MSFAMRVNFVDVIEADSLQNRYIGGKKEGYFFRVRLSYYRGHFLSDIDCLEVTTDGESVPEENVTFCLNGKELSVNEVKEAYTEFWRILDPAEIRVYQPGGLAAGSHHIDFKLMLRVPYLPLPGADNDHTYMPLDSCGSADLEVKEAGGIIA